MTDHNDTDREGCETCWFTVQKLGWREERTSLQEAQRLEEEEERTLRARLEAAR